MSKRMAMPVGKQKMVIKPCKETNPMLIKGVLQVFFEQVPLKELKTLRQVCKLWREVSLPRWRREVWVKLGELEGTGSLNLEQYLDFIKENPADQYHRKFKLEGWYLRSQSVEDENKELKRRQLEFWNKCGPRMTHLEIAQSTFHSRQEFEAVLFRFYPNLELLYLNGNKYNKDKERLSSSKGFCLPSSMKALKELKVKLQADRSWRSDGGTDTNLPVPWYKLLRHYSMIESLTLKDIDNDGCMERVTYEFEGVLAAMISLAKNGGIEWKLKKLDILMRSSMHLPVFDRRGIDLLRQLQLPLTTLSLDIGSNTKYGTLKGILETFACTLRKLLIFRFALDEKDKGYGQPFPFRVQLDALEELCLAQTAAFETLKFLPFTPNLRRLALIQDIGNSLLRASSYLFVGESLENLVAGRNDFRRSYDRPEKMIRRTDDFVCSHMEEFIYSARDVQFCSKKEVEVLAKLMPNLKKLMLGMGYNGFRVACEAWKELEVLVVQPYEIDGMGLTGVVPMLSNRFPNLTDLKRLRYFGMGYECGNESYITDESALKGILSLENLQDITIVCSDKISDEVYHQLNTRFPRSKINKAKDRPKNEDTMFEWPLDQHSYYSPAGSSVGSNTSTSSSDDVESESESESEYDED